MIEELETRSEQRAGDGGSAVGPSLRSMGGLGRGRWRRRLTSPAAALGMGLVLAAGLMLLPASWSDPAKGHALGLLRPGQVAVSSLRERGSALLARATAHFDTAARLAEAELACRRLADENRRLAAELALAECRAHRADRPTGQAASEPLLQARCVEARVLGRLARTFLSRQRVVDVGSEAGIQPDAPVLPSPPILDQGRDAGLEPGQPVLGRGLVCGKVVRVGRYTSLVQTLTDPGYRELVRLGPGSEGILEGTGQALARIRLIEVTEPVSVGDLVYSTAGEGVLSEPLVCGRVARVERALGAAHWDIWMEPAFDPARTDQLAVLRIEVNPVRVGSRR